MPASTRPATVSAYLARNGYPRSTSYTVPVCCPDHRRRYYTEGYKVTTDTGRTVVRYLSGNTSGIPGHTRALVAEKIETMAATLAARYSVTVYRPLSGDDYRITVLPKE